MPVVLWRLGEASRVIYTVVVEKDALNLMAFCQGRYDELIGSVGRLVRIVTFAHK